MSLQYVLGMPSSVYSTRHTTHARSISQSDDAVGSYPGPFKPLAWVLAGATTPSKKPAARRRHLARPPDLLLQLPHLGPPPLGPLPAVFARPQPAKRLERYQVGQEPTYPQSRPTPDKGIHLLVASSRRRHVQPPQHIAVGNVAVFRVCLVRGDAPADRRRSPGYVGRSDCPRGDAPAAPTAYPNVIGIVARDMSLFPLNRGIWPLAGGRSLGIRSQSSRLLPFLFQVRDRPVLAPPRARQS